MEFEEVNNFIKTGVSEGRGVGPHLSSSSLDNMPSFEHHTIVSNPYNSLIHQPIVRKPTLSNFVHRLKQQSSKTRFVEKYKKLANVSDSLVSDDDTYLIEDNASIRIIDPTRPLTRDPEEEELLSDDSEVANLGISSNRVEKKPIKKVKINESANQILHHHQKFDTSTIASFEEPKGDVSSTERFVTFDVAISIINKDISDKSDEILKQMKRIEINKDEITKYKQDLLNMQKQLDFFHYSLSALKSDHIPDMIAHQTNAFKNAEKMKDNKKKNVLLKMRFDRYRKAISLDTRLLELEKKINAAWRRDEIWTGIRDWGFLSVLLFSLVIASFIAWQS